jgi:hypothetical protein
MISKLDEIRIAAESSLEVFINLVHPQRLLGHCHKELITWWTRQEAKPHQLVLWPRDHGKSAMIAYRVAWEITKNPAIRVLYISSTANLAEKQLKFIKDILDSKQYRRYWPEMTNPDEGKREKWTSTEISVDHPRRKAEYIRDPTVFTGGLTTGLTGMHCDIAVLDDVVVRENAYTDEGRDKVRAQYSLLASIESADAREWVVGTRYFPTDLYNDLLSMQTDEFNEEGEITHSDEVYETMEAAVEDVGDGTGQFLWPRQQRSDGKWFGFDSRILATKRSKYLDKTQFRAQYYNNPNDSESAPISRDLFQYYNRGMLERSNGLSYKGRRLNVFAAVDFAYSLRKKADFTAIVVVGVDAQNNYYVLDIERFKTNKIKEYFDRILKLHNLWGFRKIRAEVTSGQLVIVNELKENYIRAQGIALSVEEHRPSRHDGSKEERMESILNPRYENLQVFHYSGGQCEILEEELVLQNPAHDDIKDCLASCMEICVAPSQLNPQSYKPKWDGLTHSRFGGIA